MALVKQEIMERIESEGRVQRFDLSKDMHDSANDMVMGGVLEIGLFDTDIYGNVHEFPQPYYIKKRIKDSNN
ncbi:hypothetical protein LMH73_011880 [Vibrio splendidus]|nr:hypothetical protein [Vibrio splendidus]MCC4881551.1 hypothetical protein [Vibrio splendidus]